MYIFELINKIKNKKNPKKTEKNIEEEQVKPEEEVLNCEHVFMPIDSTKTVLACSKCGYVIRNEKQKFDEIDKNPFIF